MTALALLIALNLIILVAHLIEEIKTGFFDKFPLGKIPTPLAIGLNSLLYLGILLTIYLALAGNPVAVTLAWVFALLMLSNALLHLGLMLRRKRYFPGGITAGLLLPASIWLLLYLYRL
ncbi:MAG: HXXEE domain-containing protein [bacterium]